MEKDPNNLKAIEGINECSEYLREIKALNASAAELYNVGKFSEAIEKWKQVLNKDPKDETAIKGKEKAEKEIYKHIKLSKREPAAFISYVHLDNIYENGRLTKFGKRLSNAVRFLGEEQFQIFQDHKDIQWGENWRERIEKSLDQVSFLIPIITPSYFRSPECREELEYFIKRENILGRNDLILPVYYLSTPLIDDEIKCATDKLAQVIAAHQHVDWRDLRLRGFESLLIRKAIEEIAKKILTALERVRER